MLTLSGLVGFPPGEYASSRLFRRAGVYALIIGSTAPGTIAKKRFGLPNSVKLFPERSFQSGWLITATLYPASINVLPRRAAANDGWSTYASAETKMMSGFLFQSFFASLFFIGRY